MANERWSGEFVACRMHAQQATEGLIRYVRSCDVAVPALAFEHAVDRFMEGLLARLEALGATDEDLTALWREVVAERSDVALSRLRRHEAILGQDPDSVPEATIQSIAASGQWMGEAALDEVMTASRLEQVESSLRRLEHWRMTASLELDVTEVQRLKAAWPSSGKVPVQPWERGVQLAQLARSELGLHSEPLASERLCELLAADLFADNELVTGHASEPIYAGFRPTSGSSRVRAVLRRTRHVTGRRFEIARLLADLIIAPAADRVLPINDARTAVPRSRLPPSLCAPEQATRAPQRSR